MAANDLDLAAELRASPVFAEMSKEAIADVAQAMQQLRAHAGISIVEQGVVAPALYFLLRGAAKIMRVTSAGSRGGHETVVIDVMRGPALITESSILDGEPAPASIVTLRSSQLGLLDRRALTRLSAAHPTFTHALLVRVARDLRNQTRRFDDLIGGPVDERIKRLLETLAEQHGTPLGQGRFIAIPLRRRDIACMVHATTETVSRLLARFERDGQARSTRDGIWWRTRGVGASLNPDSLPAPPSSRALISSGVSASAPPPSEEFPDSGAASETGSDPPPPSDSLESEPEPTGAGDDPP